MLKNPLENKTNEWARTDEEFREINLRINHLAKRLFLDYLPCLPPAPDFFVRLKKWIENVKQDNDQKLLFQIVPEIFFVGPAEFNSLYRTAYNVEVSKWLIDAIDLKFNDADAEKKLEDAAIYTWFCAATDSFIINDFFKINSIPSQYNIRPDWHTLTVLGDVSGIKNYVTVNKIERIVILEDFVGSGSQIKDRIEFICDTLPDVNILFVALIICPKGVDNFSKLSTKYPKLTIKYIIKLDESLFIAEDVVTGETELFTNTREMVARLYPITTDGKTSPRVKPYYPLGYKKTGALIVLCTNTPDNTLPVIHWESRTWYPLFKRITRV
jgi:hypothetical protein